MQVGENASGSDLVDVTRSDIPLAVRDPIAGSIQISVIRQNYTVVAAERTIVEKEVVHDSQDSIGSYFENRAVIGAAALRRSSIKIAVGALCHRAGGQSSGGVTRVRPEGVNLRRKRQLKDGSESLLSCAWVRKHDQAERCGQHHDKNAAFPGGIQTHKASAAPARASVVISQNGFGILGKIESGGLLRLGGGEESITTKAIWPH